MEKTGVAFAKDYDYKCLQIEAYENIQKLIVIKVYVNECFLHFPSILLFIILTIEI